MADTTDQGRTPASKSRVYKLVSASYRDQAYDDGILLLDPAKREIELRQLAGRRKKRRLWSRGSGLILTPS